ncbi:CAMK family protein kinase [Trichomonas vaginalis G3]|uniref:non-specific serine/threonine protein kinase n=1 Tax=Trichomonas vaginalis (strain ATCC PRA-98 / G3) TaxID=412133 RepID=A2ESP5_TRIV3|nr:protein serine/threonine kinase protein [Trichomonas vaginalis G3]EAY04354.1 CAMK family protein kinase [Trichomonas vaginalis G3]KAI5551927.1 protein serine/threonine kinase protein [Trichomonas vaginalis G3]|eukprot:XP_001316577.1 CAMK family protein kinase [Trichomonas vaginalis G3]
MEEQILPPNQQIGDYLLQEKVGHGGFSNVYMGIHLPTQTVCAIKVITKDKLPREIYEREVKLMKMLDHPFCLTFYESLEDENNYYMAMENVENGTVLTEINKTFGLPEWKARHVFCQLICTLDYLHNELHIAHRDLKAENIMFDRNNNIRLIDFGLGNTFTEEAMLKTACGSPAYAPPEMLCGKPYNDSADLWSAGVVLFAMVIGRLPFQDNSIQRLAQKIVYSQPQYSPNASLEVQDLLSKLLEKDPAKRITIPEIYEHPWFKKYPDAEVMRGDFGLMNGWRNPPNTQIVPNPFVYSKMQSMGIPLEGLDSLIVSNVFNRAMSAYRIIRRELVTDAMSGYFERANPEGFKHVPLTLQIPHPSSVIRRRPTIYSPMSPGAPVHKNPLSVARTHRRRTVSNADVMVKDPNFQALRAQYAQATGSDDFNGQVPHEQQQQNEEAQLPSLCRLMSGVRRARVGSML